MTLASRYAHAIHEVRRSHVGDGKALISSVIEALKRRHHEKLLPAILEEYQKIELQEEKRYLTLRLASEKDRSAALAKLKELEPDAAHPRVVIDPVLVRGFVIEGKDFRYDSSAKRSLLDLYKQLITT